MVDTKNYTIDKKEEIRRMSRTGELIYVLRIQATSKGGVPFWLEVDEANLANADKLLTAKAQKLDAI